MEQGQDTVLAEHDIDLNAVNTHGDGMIEGQERILRSHPPRTAVGKGYGHFLLILADGILCPDRRGGVRSVDRNAKLQQEHQYHKKEG